MRDSGDSRPNASAPDSGEDFGEDPGDELEPTTEQADRPSSWMSSTSEPQHLSNHHRDTLLQVFQHPTSHNIEWQTVLSLLEAVGSVEQRHDGKYLVHVGDETVVFARPRNKDVDVQQVVDLRRILTSAGYGPVVEALEAKGEEV
jgi:hypothetical protein